MTARPCRFLTPEGISASRLVPLGQRKLSSISLANKKTIEFLLDLLRQPLDFTTKGAPTTGVVKRHIRQHITKESRVTHIVQDSIKNLLPVIGL